MEKNGYQDTSHLPAFRLRVAEQMADYRQRLAERLEHERTKRSLSQDDLALRSGVSPKTIKRIEEEKVTNPRPVTIRRLAEGLDIEPDQLRPPTDLEEDQLTRIEAKLDQLLDHFDVAELEELADGAARDDGREDGQTPKRLDEVSQG
jgi:transcriptional regulator with XRE-family HTH domain